MTDVPLPDDLGLRIRAARQQAGLTQSQLAERVGGVYKGTVSKWESGAQSPSRHLAAIEAALGIQLSDHERPALRLSDLAQLSNAELTNHLARIVAEVARRLPDDPEPDPTVPV